MSAVTKILSVLVLVVFISVYIQAQEAPSPMKFSLNAGASIPTGDFSATSGTYAGYATTGFCASIEGTKNLSPSVNWRVTLNTSINSFDETALHNQLSGLTVSAGSYWTSWLMTGIGINAPVAPTADVYLFGEAGLLLSSLPDITISSGSSSITQKTDMAAALAFSVGAGIKFTQVTISVRYLSAKPEYTETASSGGSTASVKVKMPADIIQVMLGINL